MWSSRSCARLPSRGRAHTRFVGLRPFAFLLSRSSRSVFVTKDHPEVSSLSGRDMDLVSDPLLVGLRLFRNLLPAPPTALLAVCLPFVGQRYGLTVFHLSDTVG